MRISKRQFKSFIRSVGTAFSSSFNESEITKIAGESGFRKRVGGKLDGATFLKLVVFNAESLKGLSLDQLSSDAYDDYKVNISKQALHNRFNTCAVLFIKQALQEVLKQQIKTDSLGHALTGFNRVIIKDSTAFGLDDSYYDIYPIDDKKGTSGKAAIRIQFEYDMLSGNINELSIHPFRDQDNCDWQTTNELIEENDLVIRDLGYMHIASIKDTTVKQKAHVLCRLNTRTNAYTKTIQGNYEKVDFNKVYAELKDSQLSYKNLDVYIGADELLPMRMVVYLLPDDIAERNTRNKRKERKRNGSKSIRKETLIRCKLVILITDVCEELLNSKILYTLYSARWQIELIFKSWKSVVKINKVKKVKVERLQCYLYAKLLFIVLGSQLYWQFNKIMYKWEKQRLSMFKTFRYFLRKVNMLLTILWGKKKEKENYLYKLFQHLERWGKLETKKGNLDLSEIVKVVLKTQYI